MVDAGTQEQAQEAPAPSNKQDEGDDNLEDEEMLETPMEVMSKSDLFADNFTEVIGTFIFFFSLYRYFL